MGKKKKNKQGQTSACVGSSSSSKAPPLPTSGTPVSFCVFHHLLEGKSHKKEKELVSEARSSGCNGRIVYGTPGIIITDAAQDDVKSLMAAARTIGKRGDVTRTLYHASKNGVFTGKKGLSSCALQDLKSLLLEIHTSHNKGTGVDAATKKLLDEQFKSIIGM